MADLSSMRPFEQLRFSDAEKIFYTRVFNATKVSNTDIVKGAKLMEVLKSSALLNNQLAELWDVCDRGRKGHLTQTELFVLLRAVSLTQKRGALPTAASLETEISIDMIAHLEGIPHVTATEADAALRARIAGSANGDTNLRVGMGTGAVVAAFGAQPFFALVKDVVQVRTHVEYVFEVTCSLGLLDNNATSVTVTKRFSDFEKFRNQLAAEVPGALIPLLPPKTPPNSAPWSILSSKKSATFDDAFLEQRKQKLLEFLNRILADTRLNTARTLLAFVQGKELEIEKPVVRKKSTAGEGEGEGNKSTTEGESGGGGASSSAAVLMSSGPGFRSSISKVLGSNRAKGNQRLEYFLQRLDQLDKALSTALKKIQALSNMQAQSVALTETFLMEVVPPSIPISLGECVGHNRSLADKFAQMEQKDSAMIDTINSMLGEVKAMKQAIDMAAAAEAHFNALLADPKTTDVETINQRLAVAKQTVDEEILRFETRHAETMKTMLRDLIAREHDHSKFQTEWNELLLQRVLFAEHSTLSATIDVPRCLTSFQELTWLPEGVSMSQFGDVIDRVRFDVGQPSRDTIAPLAFGSSSTTTTSQSTASDTPTPPAQTTSFGHAISAQEPSKPTPADSNTKSKAAPAKKLPAYAFADGTSRAVETQGDRDREGDLMSHLDDLNKDLGLSWDNLQTSGSVSLPDHWVEKTDTGLVVPKQSSRQESGKA